MRTAPVSAEVPSVILGISADLHDAAAALVIEGRVVAAAEEERFTRRKHDPSLPRHAIEWCLRDAGIGSGDLSTVAFHDKPFTVYERFLASHARSGPRGLGTLATGIATWSRSKLWTRARIEHLLGDLGHPAPRIVFAEHHHSHAAAAFYPSPFERAAILTFDGVGEWTTSSIAVGNGNRIEMVAELEYPDSIGLLYSTITSHCGFAVNDGEYKLMGLAPYGEPRYADALRDHVVTIHDDGSVRLDQRWFAYQWGTRMGRRRLDTLLGGPPRRPDEPLTSREADLAASMQVLLEEIVLRIADHAHRTTGERDVCLAGGVALNCVANARLLRDGPFDDVWVQPAAGDDGSAIGAALWAHHQIQDRARDTSPEDGMAGCLLGPRFDPDEIAAWLEANDVEFRRFDHVDALCDVIAGDLADGAVVGWFRGRMEFGPRALGSRSILADPRRAASVERINAAVKGREGFRPFAPAVLEEQASTWFELDRPSPYMLFTAAVAPNRRRTATSADVTAAATFAERLTTERSEIPACTHVDHSARVQTVSRERHPDFHRLLTAFAASTGCPVLLNTSFNRRDEPIVRSPADALRCFETAGLDVLVLEDCVVRADALARAEEAAA